MVIGVHRRFAATHTGQRLIGDASNHLIDVHVRLRAAARLPDGQRKLVVMFSGKDGIGGRDDRICNLCRHRP